MRMILTLTLAIVAGLAGGVAADHVDVLRLINPVFSAGWQPQWSSNTWAFRNEGDGGTARLLVDSQGVHDGAAPNGYAVVDVRAQDEIRNTDNTVLASSDVHGQLRVMSHSYAYRDSLSQDPRLINCRGTQCGDMTELYSDQWLRLTAGNAQAIDFLTRNRARLAIDGDGNIFMQDLKADSGTNRYLCINGSGRIYSQSSPCA